MLKFKSFCILFFVIYNVRSSEVTYQNIMNDALHLSRIKNNEQMKEIIKSSYRNGDSDEEARTLKTMYNIQKAISELRDGEQEEDIAELTVKNFRSSLNESYPVSDICMNHTFVTIDALLRKEGWALSAIDSFAKIPSGILNGNLKWFGSYDECREVKGLQYGVENPKAIFNGKYCFLVGYISKQVLYSGICVPDSCSTEDVNNIFHAGLSMIEPVNKTIPFGVYCPETDVALDGRAIGALFVTAVILFCMLVGTLYDVIVFQIPERKRKEVTDKDKTPLLNHAETNAPKVEIGIFSKILLAFSVYTNGKKLLNTTQAEGSLTAVNGIRFLSMSWVILGHTYGYSDSFSDNTLSFLPKLLNRWTFQVIANASISVDTFFSLSGLLLAYLFLKGMKKQNGKMNWGLFYFHRFWRLTPPYMLVLFLEVSLSRYLADGPMWPTSDGFEKDFCKDTWWTNLLYINNIVKSDNMCMGWSWYLACDMQFFIISPLLLLPLYYSTAIGLGVSLFFLLGSWITTGIVSTHYELPAAVVSDVGSEAYTQQYYYRPYTRIGPYIVGIVAGYFLYKTENGFKMNKLLNLAGWLIATVLACVNLYGLYDMMSSGEGLSIAVASLYNTVHRSLWGACVCWVIFSCARGYGGFVNTILSWKAFVPLSRLTYCTYLIHLIIIETVYASRRTLIHATDITMIYLFLAHLVASMIVACVTSLAFEAPMMALEKAILSSNKK